MDIFGDFWKGPQVVQPSLRPIFDLFGLKREALYNYGLEGILI